MASKKERNHYDLKKIENNCITKKAKRKRRDWLEKTAHYTFWQTDTG